MRGWSFRDEEIREKIVLAKQGRTCTAEPSRNTSSTNTSATKWSSTEHVATIARTYRRRRDVMADALADFASTGLHFAAAARRDVSLGHGSGDRHDRVARLCAEQKVVFVPGVSFYPARDVHDGMRLNFSNASEEMIRVGIERLGHAIDTFKR